MANIGFIGLGVMGSRIVKRLLDAGHSVTGYNRTKSKAQGLLDAGMKWGDSPQAVAKTVDVVFTMVSNTSALQAVTGGSDGLLAGLRPGAIFVDMSTVSPEVIRSLAAQVTSKGAQMLDAPVSGSVTTLEEGKLSIMVGGDPASFERVQPILPASRSLAGRAPVLDEEVAPAWLEHPPHLAQGTQRVADGAERPGGHHAVEASCVERELAVGAQRAALHREGRTPDPLLHRGQVPRRLRIEADHPLHARRVEAQVQSGTEAHLQHLALGFRDGLGS